MNAVGDVVARADPGRSDPRGAVAPPQTRTSSRACLTASYVVASSRRYAAADTICPPGPNWGSQKRLRFGSLPTIKSRTVGSAAATAAAYAANSDRASAASGVVAEPE